jgi:hypothetical protein
MANTAKFYIDGEWVDPISSRTVEVIDPTTETPIATVALADDADVDRAVAAAKRAFETFSQTSVAERIALPVRREGRQLARHARAGRRRRGDHAVELPAEPDHAEGRARARRRLHRGAQAQRGRADQRVHPGRGLHPRRRPAARRVQPGHRPRPGRRRGARRAPGRRHGVVHRLHRAPASGVRGRRADRQARRARARRQERVVVLDDADFEKAVKASVVELLHELRPDLLGVDAPARAARAARRGPRDRQGRRRVVHRRQRVRRGREARAAGVGAAARPRARLHPPGIDEGAELVTGGAERPRGSAAATS